MPTVTQSAPAHDVATVTFPGFRGMIPDVIDPEKERERLQRELKKVAKELDLLVKKLANASFVDRAPADVVEKARQDRGDLEAQKAQLEGALARLGA